MEEQKKIFLQEFLEESQVSVKECIAAIAERETRLRNCYADNFENISTEDFVKMMLLDSSFIIMVFLKQFSRFIPSNYDRIFGKPWMIRGIDFDMCLLENQIPFFILDDLLKLSKRQGGCSMIELTRDFLSSTFGDSWVQKDILEQINSSEVEHFVDFLRICQQPAQEMQPKKLANLTTPSVAELHRAGIKFKLGSSINPLLIKFDDNKGTLEIPQLKIGDHAEILFRNLQAFEQCNYDANKYVCNYITMLSLLVPDAKDVEILVKEGIIENWVHDNDAVSRLFRSLSEENVINVNNFYFSGVVEDLNKYYSKRVHKWKAALKQKYFRNPWTIISVVAAAVLVILTIIQAVCSIIQVV
jgi:hypothetical protein